MKLKYCGLHHANTFKLAQTLGVDYTGIIHYPPSPRHCSEDHIKKLQTKLAALKDETEDDFFSKKEPKTVLVVVNSTVRQIVSLVKKFSFHIVQLHGNETSLFVKDLTATFNKENLNISIWKALHIRPTDTISIKLFSPYVSVSHFIVEPYHEKFGGAGKTMPIDMLKHLLTYAYRVDKKIFAAGGINIKLLDSLAIVAEKFPNLYGLDVNSGLEKISGIKDFDLMREFYKRFKEVFN